MQTESKRLDGKVAIVTGAGAGIGAGCSLMFARHGAKVIACDIDADALAATVRQASDAGFPIAGSRVVDLTDETAVEGLVDYACQIGGGIDVLVNAAAFAVMRWIEEMTLTDWRTTLTGELDIVFIACKAVWASMKERGRGSIINFSSANAHMALAGSPALAHCAGKGGVLAMTHQLAMEGAPLGIRANSIAPGLVQTAATAGFVADPAVADVVRRRHMIARLGTPDDIAWAALFLASEESAWITATEFRVDGGVTHW
jgi:NAD(P)-dependent dehydrogenase (short-subunit alcohol dehydrogenase family)